MTDQIHEPSPVVAPAALAVRNAISRFLHEVTLRTAGERAAPPLRLLRPGAKTAPAEV